MLTMREKRAAYSPAGPSQGLPLARKAASISAQSSAVRCLRARGKILCSSVFSLFLFGSLNPDVLPLEEFLGESRKIIDLIVDQSPEGLEVLRGSSTYVYEGIRHVIDIYHI